MICPACKGNGSTQYFVMELDKKEQEKLLKLDMSNKEVFQDFVMEYSKIRSFPCWHCRKEHAQE